MPNARKVRSNAQFQVSSYFAKLPQQIERENARIVPVTKGNGIRIVSHRLHAGNRQRLSLDLLQGWQGQRILWLTAFLATGGARTGVAQLTDRITTPLAVTP